MTTATNRAKAHARIFKSLYYAFMFLYHPAYKGSKAMAYVEQQKAFALCELWNSLHPRKTISLSDVCNLAAGHYNDLHKTDKNPAQLLDDLTEIRKAL
jgi:hypothetical protein